MQCVIISNVRICLIGILSKLKFFIFDSVCNMILILISFYVIRIFGGEGWVIISRLSRRDIRLRKCTILVILRLIR